MGGPPRPRLSRARPELRHLQFPTSRNGLGDCERLSPRQVAELLGVTRPTVQSRIHRGTLPAAENGGRPWVRRDLLEQVEAARLGGRRGGHSRRPTADERAPWGLQVH